MTPVCKHEWKSVSDWALSNPIIEIGNCAIETETGLLKIGDGKTRWYDLPYASHSTVKDIKDYFFYQKDSDMDFCDSEIKITYHNDTVKIVHPFINETQKKVKQLSVKNSIYKQILTYIIDVKECPQHMHDGEYINTLLNILKIIRIPVNLINLMYDYYEFYNEDAPIFFTNWLSEEFNIPISELDKEEISGFSIEEDEVKIIISSKEYPRKKYEES